MVWLNSSETSLNYRLLCNNGTETGGKISWPGHAEQEQLVSVTVLCRLMLFGSMVVGVMAAWNHIWIVRFCHFSQLCISFNHDFSQLFLNLLPIVFTSFFQFGDDAGKGQGQTQNEVDDLCKSLQTCYRCAKLDSLEDNEICKPGQIQYNVNVNSISNQGALLACQHPLNTDDCQIHVCSCEINFINKLQNNPMRFFVLCVGRLRFARFSFSGSFVMSF